MTARLLLLLPALSLCACAAVFKADPLVPTHYSPLEAVPASKGEAHPELTLRLRRVKGASHLRESRVYRLSEFEYRLYETRLWTEQPADYVRRSLARSIFEQRKLQRSGSTRAPTLEVEVTAFDEHRSPPAVRVEFVITLSKEDTVLLQETIRVERKVPTTFGDDGHHDAVVRASGEALGAAVELAADKVVAALTQG